jgi:hypothetical protein
MPRGGTRFGAGRPKGSGRGRTVEIKSISLRREIWQRIDEARGSVSRSSFIAAKLESPAVIGGQYVQRGGHYVQARP